MRVGYEFELLNEDCSRETFEGIEDVSASADRACDIVEGWYRDTYGDLAYWNAWIIDSEGN